MFLTEGPNVEYVYAGLDAAAAVMKDDPTMAVTALVSQMEFISEVRARLFVPAADFAPARLSPDSGCTLLGKAIDAAMDALDRFVADLCSHGIPAHRRLLVFLTDATTRDAIYGPITRAHKAEADGLWVHRWGTSTVRPSTASPAGGQAGS